MEMRAESPEKQNQEHNAGADLQHLESSALGRLKRVTIGNKSLRLGTL
jgi:hypothetical protein